MSSVEVDGLRPLVKQFVLDHVQICQPDKVHVCDGSLKENQMILEKLQKDGRAVKLTKYDNWSVH